MTEKERDTESEAERKRETETLTDGERGREKESNIENKRVGDKERGRGCETNREIVCLVEDIRLTGRAQQPAEVSQCHEYQAVAIAAVATVEMLLLPHATSIQRRAGQSAVGSLGRENGLGVGERRRLVHTHEAQGSVKQPATATAVPAGALFKGWNASSMIDNEQELTTMSDSSPVVTFPQERKRC